MKRSSLSLTPWSSGKKTGFEWGPEDGTEQARKRGTRWHIKMGLYAQLHAADKRFV